MNKAQITLFMSQCGEHNREAYQAIGQILPRCKDSGTFKPRLSAAHKLLQIQYRDLSNIRNPIPKLREQCGEALKHCLKVKKAVDTMSREVNPTPVINASNTLIEKELGKVIGALVQQELKLLAILG